MLRCHSRRLSSLHQPRRSMWPLRFRRLLTCSFAPTPAGSIPRTPLLLDSSWSCCRACLRSRRAARPDGFPPVRSCSSRTPTGQAIPPVFLRTAWPQSRGCDSGCAATTLPSTRSRPSGVYLSRTACPIWRSDTESGEHDGAAPIDGSALHKAAPLAQISNAAELHLGVAVAQNSAHGYPGTTGIIQARRVRYRRLDGTVA